MARIEDAFAVDISDASDSPPHAATCNGPKASTECAEIRRTPAQSGVGEGRLSHSPDLCFFVRVARTQRLIAYLQPVSDAEILQHARDLTQLMEQAWKEYEATHDEFPLTKARTYMTQRDAARRLLSQAWKDGREAEILAACGAAYFIERGDKAREQVSANE